MGIATLLTRRALRTAQRKGEVIITGYTLELGGACLSLEREENLQKGKCSITSM